MNPPRRQVLVTAKAEADLDQIMVYYRDIGAPAIGERLVDALLDQATRLEIFPESGRRVRENVSRLHREIVHPPFRIIYFLEPGGQATVVRFVRGERNFAPNELADSAAMQA